MGKQITIGRGGNQPFAIHDPKVSTLHAFITVDDSGRMLIEDNDSTNGTYIYNGRVFERLYPNQPYKVTEDSMIQLGPDTRFHVRRLFNKIVNGGTAGNDRKAEEEKKKQQKPKRVDIKELRRVSEFYNRRKMELESKGSTINNLRSCTILITMAAGVAGTCISNLSDMDKSKAVIATVLSLVIAIVLMVTLLLIINHNQKKLIVERNENEKFYAVKYCCPSCGKSFRGQIYENILSERMCPRCKAQFYESDNKN